VPPGLYIAKDTRFITLKVMLLKTSFLTCLSQKYQQALRECKEHVERSRSKSLAVKGNSSSSAMPPTQGAKKNKSNVVRSQQHEPTQEFSIANCIHASDEEKAMSSDLFRDAVNREIFLSLDGILRTMWLKRQLTKNRWE
jgi:hypothetical protein